MNIYARFFNQDILVHNFDELIQFLQSIPDITVDGEMIEDIKHYIESDIPYPKRYKIRPRVYFILIKTNAESMDEFKKNNKKEKENNANSGNSSTKKEAKTPLLMEQTLGWYKGTLRFKRVILIPGTNKFQYKDTEFQALVFTTSGATCYQRIVDHLKGRKDVDPRSQFPSAKGSNFMFEYIGLHLPEEETA